MTTKKRSYATLALMQIAAGGSAGFVEVCLMHPLDLVKTRLQIQRGPDDPQRYKSLADCFRTMYRTEGALSFYKGILPPILAETPKRATKFFCFEQYKQMFTKLTGASTPTPLQPSAFATAREIARKEGYGLRGLNKGLTGTLGRNGVWNMVYFSFYHNIKSFFPPHEDPKMDLMRRFGIGFLGGTIASVINIPFDVAKSRIQGPQPVAGEVKYRGCFQSMALVYKEEGYLALYKGLVPKIMRLGPGGAIMLVVFEYVYEKLQTIF